MSEIKCSKRCGFGCTQKAFDQATKEANELADRMGAGWEPVVWENWGWNYKVKNGVAEIYANRNGGAVEGGWTIKGYTCYIQTNPQFIESAAEPEDALGFAVQMARTGIHQIASQLGDLLEFKEKENG